MLQIRVALRERRVVLKLRDGPLLFRLHMLHIIAREDAGRFLDLQKLSDQLNLGVIHGNPHVDEV